MDGHHRHRIVAGQAGDGGGIERRLKRDFSALTFLPSLGPGDDAVKLAALACFGGAFGRRMSPVAAVVVYCSGLVGVSPVLLVKRLAPAIVAGAIVSFVVAGL